MNKLLVADLRASWRLWAGFLIIVVYTAAVSCVVANALSSAQALGDATEAARRAQQGLTNQALIYSLINGPIIVAGLAITSHYLVRVKTQVYALWQFAGVLPRQIGRILIGQILLVCLPAFAIGAVVSVMLADFNYNVAAGILSGEKDSLWPGGLPIVVSPLYVLAALVIVLVITLLSATFAIGRAMSVPALALLVRPGDDAKKRVGIIRWSVGGVVFAGALVAGVLAGGGAAGNANALAILLGLVSYLTLSSWASSLLIRFWTRIVPATVSSRWFLARSSAAYFSNRSSTVISFIVVPVTLWSLMLSLGTFGTGNGDKFSGLLSGMLMFGPPIAMALVTAAITLFMAAPDRRKERALVATNGGSPRTALAVGALEALIYTVTAFLMSIVLLLFGTRTIVDFGLALLSAAIVSLIGFVILACVTMAPVWFSRRESAIEALRQ